MALHILPPFPLKIGDQFFYRRDPEREVRIIDVSEHKKALAFHLGLKGIKDGLLVSIVVKFDRNRGEWCFEASGWKETVTEVMTGTCL